MWSMLEPLSSDAADARPRRPISIVAIAALVIALVAVGLSAAAILRPAAASCQVAAWDAVPKVGEVPSGWTISSTDFYPDYQTTTIAGPASASGSAASTAEPACRSSASVTVPELATYATSGPRRNCRALVAYVAS